MPRNNRTSSRPATFNKAPAQQQRPHSTAATVPRTASNANNTPTTTTATTATQQQSSGILSNILQTAAGVAVGHTVGRMISGVFEGGNSASNAADVNTSNTSNVESACQVDTKRFLDCMAKNYDDVSACQNYLEMMKQCQRQFAQ